MSTNHANTNTNAQKSELQKLYEKAKGLPRSKRATILFDHPDWKGENSGPTEYQAELLDYLESEDTAEAAPQKGRQVGATLTAGLVGADHALWAPMLVGGPTDVLFTAPGQETADEMFKECKDYFKHGPLSLNQYGITKDNEQTWEFSSGTRILSRTLGNVGQEKQPGNRGMNPTCVVVDEAHYEQDKVFEEELEQFFITHPVYEYVLFSTPAGQSGYFYEKVKNDPDWFSPYWPTRISPFAQEDYIEKQRAKKTESVFAQEYEGKFAKDGDSAIPYSTLKPNLTTDPDWSNSVTRYLGIDPARGGSDEMVVFDLDAQGTYWNIWAFETMDGPRFVEFLEIVHTQKEELDYWNEVPQSTVGKGTTPENGYEGILIEENGVGGFAADFAEAGLGDVVKVFTSTNENKQNMYQRLITDMESEILELPKDTPDNKLENQVTSLQKTFTPTNKAKYAHPSGGHDDWPDGLALANWARHGNGDPLDNTTDVVFTKSRGSSGNLL